MIRSKDFIANSEDYFFNRSQDPGENIRFPNRLVEVDNRRNSVDGFGDGSLNHSGRFFTPVGIKLF